MTERILSCWRYCVGYFFLHPSP